MGLSKIKFKKGKVYNRLTLVKDLGVIKGNRRFQVKCECGRRVSRNAYSVITGHTKSCGCLNKEILKQLNIEKRKKQDKYIKVYKKYISGAKRRNLEFTLTEKQFIKLIKQECNYCGLFNKNGINGVDRLNSKKGYLLSNCVSACSTCNYSKWTLTKYAFLKKIKSIYNYSIKGGIK